MFISYQNARSWCQTEHKLTQITSVHFTGSKLLKSCDKAKMNNGWKKIIQKITMKKKTFKYVQC